MLCRTLILALVLLVSPCLSTALAAEPPVPIEGRILVSANSMSVGTYTYFIEGMSDNVSTPGPALPYAEVSPDMERVAYQMKDAQPATYGDVWIARLDGSEAVNVTGLAGVAGVNCKPAWSPDGTQLAFQHADPGHPRPCDVFEVWVVDTDGTNAHRASSLGSPASCPTWSPNGYRLTYAVMGVGAITIDSDGTDMAVLPNVGAMADWSPDGTRILSVTVEGAVEGGESGRWRKLLLTDADGGNPQVLFQRFLTDSDVAEHMALYGYQMPEDDGLRWLYVREGAGPSSPDWSPKGDRFVFRAAIPFDPSGLYYPYQNDLWMYDLTDHTMVPIAQDSICEFHHSWDGPNTFPDDPEVSVDDVTVTFSEVIDEGVTVILRDDDPPEVPTGFLFDYEFYELNTTAEVTGPITICMTYTDEEVPPGPAEANLFILHYDEVAQLWEDITTSHDTVNNIVCGQTDGLSPFALQGIRGTQFPDVPAWGFGTEGLDPHWSYYQVMACVEAQIVGGYPDGTYQPGAVVTRDQMAVYVARALAGGDDSVPEFTETPTFPDVGEGFWALNYVEYAVAQNVVAGYLDGYYHPAYQVDRGQMAVYVARARGWVGVDDDMTTAPELFPDVPAGFWSGTAIEACVTNGVVQGYQDGYYRPSWAVTRDQMAVYVARAFDLPM